MKKLFIAAVAVAGLVGPAIAADLPRAPVYKAPVMVEPAFNWTGFYIGLNGGYGWGSDARNDQTPGGGFWSFGTGQTIKPTGGVFGGQVGYNWQVNSNWVLGVELSGGWASLTKTDASLAFPATDHWKSEVNSLLGVTGRVGYSFGSWLPYIKGGYAGANLKSTMFDNAGDITSHSQWRNGWTVGAGFDYALSRNWIVGLEYNYIDLGSNTWAGACTGPGLGCGGSELFSDKMTISTLLGRVSYKW